MGAKLDIPARAKIIAGDTMMSLLYYELYSKRQLQGLIKQREKTVVTIFRLAWQYRSSSGLF